MRARPPRLGMALGIALAALPAISLASSACDHAPAEPLRGAISRSPDRRSVQAAQTTLPPRPAPVPSSAPVAVDPWRPLTASERALLHAGSAEAPVPVEIHYVQSNETRHDLFFPFIEDLGGAFIGVGSDQSFTLAATARAELLVLMDIDRRVVDLHEVYAVLIPEAEDADALVHAFARPQRDAVLERLAKAFASRPDAERDRLLRGYRASRETVYRHLQRVLERTAAGDPASWLSDPVMFAHVQRLYRAGRVRVLCGDLTGESSMQTIAAATTALGIHVRVLYLSNAEEYFGYTRQFAANLQALPVDGDSVVLRTIYAKTWPHADLWAYQVQPFTDFLERVGEGRGRSRNGMLRQAAREGVVDRDPGPRGLSLVAHARP